MKLQSFLLLKFSSSRLKDSKYKIEINLEQARKNNEVIRLSDNEVLRTLRKVINKPFSQLQLNDLINQRKEIGKKENTSENRLEISSINKKIDDILFVPEIISISFDDKRHYLNIQKTGLFINNKKYVRWLAGAGNLRRATVFFIQQDIKNKMQEILDNGRNKDFPLVPAKMSAYFALYNSASTIVDFPRIGLIPDKEMKKVVRCNWVSGEGKNITVEEKDVESSFNFFDGQGLASPEIMDKWAKNLRLDFELTWVTIRSSFLKGNLVNFDFKKFARYIAQKSLITDAYGNKININDVDILISTSQLKLWQSYSDIDDYTNNCKKNDISFGISRYSPDPKKEKHHVFSNYQFSQILDEDKFNIGEMCEDTINYIKNLSGGERNQMLLYLLGDGINDVGKDGWFDKIQDNKTKALILNKDAKNDSFIYNYFLKNLNKTIRDGFLGKTIHCGNFSAIIFDPYAQCSFIFGMNSRILSEGEYFSHFWNEKNVSKVSILRAPLTHNSEQVIANLVKNKETKEWFSHIKTGVILPAGSLDCMYLGGADGDGDLVMSTDSKSFIDGFQGGLPILYEEKKAEKKVITDDLLIKADSLSLESKIGFVTNVSSTYHCLLYKFQKDTVEYKEIQKRLISLRREQGKNIDLFKGILVEPFPEHWVRYEKINFSLSEQEIKDIEFNNSLVAKRRPLFFIWLYPAYMERYRKELNDFDSLSKKKFKKSFLSLLDDENKTELEKRHIERYYSGSFFLHEKSSINMISEYLQKNILELKTSIKKNSFDFSIYLSDDAEIDFDKLKKMKLLYDEYNIVKKSMRNNDDSTKENFNNYSNLNEFENYILEKSLLDISSDFKELGNLAIYLTYSQLKNGNKEFAWSCYGEYILQNMIDKLSDKKVEIPILSNDGDIFYLYKKYKNEKIDLFSGDGLSE